jgi:hypothetical protein
MWRKVPNQERGCCQAWWWYLPILRTNSGVELRIREIP